MKKIIASTVVIASTFIGCAAPPFTGTSPNALYWTITDTNAIATKIKAWDGTNWNTVVTVGVPTNTWPLAGIPYAPICATSVEADAESAGSNQVTNTPPPATITGLNKH